MNIDKLKQARSSHNWSMYANSPIIREIAPEVKTISVKVKIVFNTAVVRDPIIKEYQTVLVSQDRYYLHYDCANNTCTGYGFDLTDILRQAIRSKNTISGKINCDGKEDWKYLDSSGCSCQTTLYYEVTPHF